MTAIHIVIVILLVILIIASIGLAFMYGYEKGIHDLTEEIDEGMRKLKDEQK